MKLLHHLMLRVRQGSQGIPLLVGGICNFNGGTEANLSRIQRLYTFACNPVILTQNSARFRYAFRPELRICLVSC